MTAKKTAQRPSFKAGETIVYPAHGVGRITAIEEQEIAGFKLELFVGSFDKDKMVLRVPTAKAASVGMRKLADADEIQRALEPTCPETLNPDPPPDAKSFDGVPGKYEQHFSANPGEGD